MKAQAATPQRRKFPVTSLIGFAILALVTPALLFAAAGTLDWLMGWLYTIVTVAAAVGSRIMLLRLNPELVQERAGAHSEEGVQEWDKKIMPIVGLLGPLALLIVCGLDKRWGWSPDVSIALQLIALAMIALATIFAAWAMVANRFFSAVVRIQKDRGHTVVSSGPYRFVRHPSYLSGVVVDLAGPLSLGSLWALLPGLLLAALLIYRTAREDKALQEGLDGYKEYTHKVRARLLPGVW